MLLELERLDKPLDAILKILLLIFNFSLSLGVILLLVYCVSIDYYPSGITIADGFIFIAICLSFSFGYLLVVTGLFCAGVTFSPIARFLQWMILFCVSKVKKGKKDVQRINFPRFTFYDFPIYVAGLITLTAFVIIADKNSDLAYNLFLSMILMTFYYGLWRTTPQQEKQGDPTFGKRFKIGLAVAIALTPLLVGHIHGNVLKNAMKFIGVRTDDATVRLEKKYAQFMTLNGIEPAQKNGKKIPGLYSNVKVLFNGIGANDVIEVDGFRLIVPKKEITIGKKANNG